MVNAFVQIILDNLNSLIQKEVGLLCGVDKEMKKLSSLLSTILAVLEDAEEKQLKDKAIQNWLWKLKDAANKIDDILDECAIEASRLEFKGQNSRLIDKVNTSFLNSFRPNNILFRRKTASRMREVKERLDEIAEERMKFHLNEVVTEKRFEISEGRQTGSIITQSQVYGRDEDKEKVVECLLKRVACCDHISIYPIVGIGGLGKTTLAQVVYNDERVRKHFELRIWVCISEDFTLRKIMRAIIESATGTACETLDLDPLQRRIQDILNGKRYLLVLDDVWNEDQEKWERLKCVLACGSKGASVIVTTRIKRVASITGTLPLHHLSDLTEDDCWSLFRERAFGPEKEELPKFVALGKEIVKKCRGVPLAVKSLGSLMRYKSEENEWLSVNESELWNLPQDEYSFLPALRLSYSHLPSKIKQCFAYCAIFPKNFAIGREILIHLWMANGFIPSSGKLEPEDIGNEICNELYWRSFFQDAKKDNFGNIAAFKMHDLVHDLAQAIMEDECCTVDAKSSSNISKRTIHVKINIDLWQSFTSSEPLCEVETLRTLFLVSPISSTSSSGINVLESSCDFSRLVSLRVFHAHLIGVKKLSSSISHLKHLRYLDLSCTDIELLPDSLCSLINLQTLNLGGCISLRELPKRMRCLKNLRHLYLNNCYQLSQMPPKIGQITCLKTLTLFIVGKGKGRHLAELKVLNLQGELHVKHLNRVENLMDAREANLAGKRNLRRLNLSWERNSECKVHENTEKVLEALEPHSNLEHLTIEEYKGAQFPLWISNRILNNLISIKLSNCMNCFQLPQLGQLHTLRYLEIDGMPHLLNIDHNFQGGGLIKGFPFLEELVVSNLPSLERFSREDGREMLPCLTKLRIRNCPKLSLPCLPSIKYLSVIRCSEVLLRSISNLRGLTRLNVHDNHDLIYLPHGMLQNLKSLLSLNIENFSKLKGFPTEVVSLRALKSFHVGTCHELESLPDQGLEGLKCLKLLALSNCRKFSTLPEGLKHLSALERLNINGCPELVALPDGIKYLSSLQQLTISGRHTGIHGSFPENPTGFCKLLVRYTNDCPKLAELPESLRHIPVLKSLRICCYPDLASLPYWLGDLTSLQSLQLFDCPKLSLLPASIQSLSNLRNLYVSECPELVKRCEKETGEDWYKIAHVQNVYVEPLIQTG